MMVYDENQVPEKKKIINKLLAEGSDLLFSEVLLVTLTENHCNKNDIKLYMYIIQLSFKKLYLNYVLFF